MSGRAAVIKLPVQTISLFNRCLNIQMFDVFPIVVDPPVIEHSDIEHGTFS